MESFAAASQGFLTQKEEITTLLHRELPRVCLSLNGKKFEKAHPGKAYENATLKMVGSNNSVYRVQEYIWNDILFTVTNMMKQ